jgi:hypothetical protein
MLDENLKKRNQLEYLGVYVRIALKLILNMAGECVLDSFGPG